MPAAEELKNATPQTVAAADPLNGLFNVAALVESSLDSPLHRYRLEIRDPKRVMHNQQVYLIRHGETEWSVDGRHTGVTDLPLTDNGRAIAKKLQPLLANVRFEAVLTSPLGRARETCELAGFAQRRVIDHDLMEWNYGEYEGVTTKEIQAKAPGWMLFRDGCPGGESPGDIGVRVDTLIGRVRSVDGHVALFGHGHMFRVFAARWLGLEVVAGGHFLLDTATLNILSYYQDIPAVKRWNAALVL